MGNCLSAPGGSDKKKKNDGKKKQRRQNSSDLLPITEQGSSTANQADSSSFVRSSQRQPSGRSEGGGGGSSTNNRGAADGRRRGGMNERNSTKESDTRSPQQRRQQRRDSTGSGTTTHSSSSQAAGSVRGSPRLGPNTRGTPKQSPALRSGSGPTSLPVPPPPPPPPRSPTTPAAPAETTIPSTTTPVLRSSASPLANATRTTTRQSPAASPLSTRSPQQHNGRGGDSVFTLTATTGRSPQLAPRSPAGLFSTTTSPNKGNTAVSSSSSTIRNPLVAPPPPTTSFIRSTPSDDTTTTRTTTTASSVVVDGMPKSDAAASSNASSNPIASLDAQSTFSNPANTPTLNFSRHVMSPLVLPTAVNVPTTTMPATQAQSTPQTNPAPPPIPTTHIHIQRRSPTTSATSPVAVVPRGNPGTPPPSNATTVTGSKVIPHAFDQEDDIHDEVEKQLNMAEMVEPSASTKFGMPSSLSASTISAGTASSHASHNLPSRGDHTMQTQIFSARRRRSSGEGGSGYPAASGGLRLSSSTDQLATIASGGDVDAFSRQSSTVSGPRGSFLTMRSTTGSTTLSSLTVGAHDGLFQQRITPRQAGLRTRVASFHEVDGDTNSRHLSYSVNSGSRGSYGGRDSRGLSLEGFMLAPQLQPHNGAGGGGGNSNGGVRAGDGPLGQPYSLSTHANGRTLSSELERSFDDHTANSTSFHENLGTASLISGRSRLRSETSDWVVSPHISSGRSVGGGGGGGDEGELRFDFDNISSAAATPQPVVISPVAVDTSNGSNATRMRLPRFTTTH